LNAWYRNLLNRILRSTTDKCMKLQNFCKAKDNVNWTKQPMDWGKKIFINPTSNRGLISKKYQEPKKLNSNKPNNPIKNGAQKLGTQRQRGRGMG